MPNSDDKIKTIDVKKVLESKLGSKVRFVPKFVLNWLRKILHEDEINEYLDEVKDIKGVKWLDATRKYLDMRIKIEGEENFPSPENGPYTFVCNHPLGGPDGIGIGAVLADRYGEKLKYLVNSFLMFLPGLKPLCIPVTVSGAQNRNLPQLIKEGFESDNNILMFPAALCSRRHGGVIHDVAWKKTFITRSVATKRDVVPMHFSGRNSNRFYRIARLCEIFHSPVNFAMLFLADETYLNRHKDFVLKVGKPIPWQTFDKSKTASEWASYVESICYSL